MVRAYKVVTRQGVKRSALQQPSLLAWGFPDGATEDRKETLENPSNRLSSLVNSRGGRIEGFFFSAVSFVRGEIEGGRGIQAVVVSRCGMLEQGVV
ncbi:hypothetical protein E2C01_088843 [Portunus trituberculatus]|uniref:Uncharacterized protein n=1 Tax=Portunus trituberculatus TaxID=210409 RepID=A0A5B7JH59_PORTR|nr:hypothetical protein [Portunus trituberculatus]